MKQFYLIILILLIGVIPCFSQIEEGKYYPIPKLKKVEGTWVGTNNGDSLVVQLVSQKTFLKGPDIYADRLVGTHEYFRNGNHVEESKTTGSHSITYGTIDKEEGSVILGFFLRDLTKNKRGRLTLELTSMEATEARWKLRNTQGIRVDESFDPEFTLPKDMVLRKIQ